MMSPESRNVFPPKASPKRKSDGAMSASVGRWRLRLSTLPVESLGLLLRVGFINRRHVRRLELPMARTRPAPAAAFLAAVVYSARGGGRTVRSLAAESSIYLLLRTIVSASRPFFVLSHSAASRISYDVCDAATIADVANAEIAVSSGFIKDFTLYLKEGEKKAKKRTGTGNEYR